MPGIASTASKDTGPLDDDDALAALLRSGDAWSRLSSTERSSRGGDVEEALISFGDVGWRATSAVVTRTGGTPPRRRRWRSLVIVGVGTAAPG